MRTIAGVALIAFALAIALPAMAQEWRWPWDVETQPRRQPDYQRRPARRPSPSYRQDQDFSGRGSSICLQLERRLANIVNSQGNGAARRNTLARKVRRLGQQVRRSEGRLERSNCWDQFLFQKSLRNTRRCVTQYRELQKQRRALQDARAELDQTAPGNSRALQDDILRSLARNRCGAAYEQQARRIDNNANPFSSFFNDYDSSTDDRMRNTYRGLPFATYRTLCVRLCDGYYFPVSFSTLPNYFERDAQACQSRCAAPATLYYHQNPGGSLEQMVSVTDNSTYKTLKTAFKYRKEFVKGCSCKTAEYIPEGVAVTDPVETATPKRQFSPVR